MQEGSVAGRAGPPHLQGGYRREGDVEEGVRDEWAPQHAVAAPRGARGQREHERLAQAEGVQRHLRAVLHLARRAAHQPALVKRAGQPALVAVKTGRNRSNAPRNPPPRGIGGRPQRAHAGARPRARRRAAVRRARPRGAARWTAGGAATGPRQKHEESSGPPQKHEESSGPPQDRAARVPRRRAPGRARRPGALASPPQRRRRTPCRPRSPCRRARNLCRPAPRCSARRRGGAGLGLPGRGTPPAGPSPSARDKNSPPARPGSRPAEHPNTEKREENETRGSRARGGLGLVCAVDEGPCAACRRGLRAAHCQRQPLQHHGLLLPRCPARGAGHAEEHRGRHAVAHSPRDTSQLRHLQRGQRGLGAARGTSSLSNTGLA